MGGLGILNLRVMNQALLAKWCWRFGVENSLLWYKLIVEKYASSFSYGIPGTVTSPHGISCWRTITETGTLVASNSTICIHAGTVVSFWHDIWIGRKCLADLFHYLYKLDNLKLATLAEHTSTDGSWKFEFKRILCNSEVNSLATLFFVIGSSSPVRDNLPDTRRWDIFILLVLSR